MPTKLTDRKKSFIYTDVLNHSTGQTTSTTFRPFTWQDYRSGESFPKWRQYIKNGFSATTQMDGVVYDIKAKRDVAFKSFLITNSQPPPPFFLATRMIDGYACLPTQLPQVFVANPASQSEAENQAVSRLLQSIRQKRTQFDGITFAGELMESFRLISSASKSIAMMIPRHVEIQKKWIKKYLGSYEVSKLTGLPVRVDPRSLHRVKSNPELWREFREGLHKRYLAFTFGVKPLMNDIHDAAETVARFHYELESNFRHTEIRGYGKAEYQATTDTFEDMDSEITSIRTVKKWRRVEIIYKGAVFQDIVIPGYGSARRLEEMTRGASLAGFTLERFVPSVWNLLPFSFLVDYFVNVSQLLNGLFTDTSSVRWLNRTQITSNLETGVKNITGVGTLGMTLGSYEASARIISRRAVAQPPVIVPEFRVPGLGSMEWLNITALLGAGAFKSSGVVHGIRL